MNVGLASAFRRPILLVVVVFVASCGSGRRSAAKTRPRAMRLGPVDAPVPQRPTTCPRGTLLIPGGHSKLPGAATVADPPGASGVVVAGFCLDRTEVTGRAYNECVSAEGCTRAKTDVLLDGYDARDSALHSTFCNAQKQANLDHPVNCVDFDQAHAYCRWRRARLPSEAEWEWAARGGEEARRHPWGDAAPGAKLVNACGVECGREFEQARRPRATMFPDDDGWPGTSPAGAFPSGASKDGIMDLAGNVSEWTSTLTSEGLVVDRGGGWTSAHAASVSSAERRALRAASRDASLGFRCAADAPATQ